MRPGTVLIQRDGGGLGASAAGIERPRLRPNRQRKERQLSRSAAVERCVRARLEFLPPRDRALLEEVFVRGRRLSEVAALTGEGARRVRRRVVKLVERVSSPGFDAVVLRKSGWPAAMSAVGEAVFLRGLPAWAAGKEAGVCRSRAQEYARAIRAIGVELKAARGRRGEAA